MRYLKFKQEILAFEESEAFNLARYAIAHPQHVYKKFDGNFTVFHNRTAKIVDVCKTGVREYRMYFYPCNDAGSMYRLCKLIKEGDNGAGTCDSIMGKT